MGCQFSNYETTNNQHTTTHKNILLKDQMRRWILIEYCLTDLRQLFRVEKRLNILVL